MMARPQSETTAGGPAFAEQAHQVTGQIVGDDDAEDKRHAHLAAVAALAGCELHRLASGGWLLTRWGLARELADLAAVGALLRQMGARR